MIIMLLIFGAFIGALAYYKYSQFKAFAAKPWKAPPTAVTSTAAKEETWQQTLDLTGTFSPVQGVTVSAEEPGKVVNIAFESNQKVKKDDLLVQLDTSVEQAQLQSAEAREKLAQSNLDRDSSLTGSSALAKKELDNDESQLQQAKADVAQYKAIITRKTIKASFAGLTGIRQVQLGQYLAAGSPVVTLQTLDPIYIDFQVPQQSLAQLQQGQAIQAVIDVFPNETFHGKITAINPEVNDTTRTVRVRAEMENPQEKIRSGMFARVTVVFEKSENYITVPQTAINRAPYGNSIYVIEKMKNSDGEEYLGVRQQFVKLGPTRGDQIAVLEGLQGGEEIVTSGLFKLRPGVEVIINNEVTPENKPAPKPNDS